MTKNSMQLSELLEKAGAEDIVRKMVLDADLVHTDETTIQVLKEPGKKAQTKSYLWAQATGSGPPIRLFGYARGRGAAHAETLFAGIKRGAALMSDGYEVYAESPKATAYPPRLLGALPTLFRRGRGGDSQGGSHSGAASNAVHRCYRRVICRRGPRTGANA
jgi:hypothetical protein